MHTYDENNLYIDEDENKPEEYEGYSVVSADEVHIDHTAEKEVKKNKKEESYDDGETVEASAIPEDEQTVMIDKPKVAGISVCDILQLSVVSESNISIYNGDKKIGELKPLYCQKLFATRKGQFVTCTFHSSEPLVMVKLKFFTKAAKGRVKIEM